MSTVAEIEAAIQALPPAERERLADDLPAILPELNGNAKWQRIITDSRPRPALTALGDEIAAQLKAHGHTMNRKQFEKLRRKFGKDASWAIWSEEKSRFGDTTIIEENWQELKPNVVMVGLNISKLVNKCWSNFRSRHGGSNDRKLRYAFNWSPYRGAYMTDLLKGIIKPNSALIMRDIRAGEIKVAKEISKFKVEMQMLGAGKDTLFVLWGRITSKLFKEHLGLRYPNHLACPHYSSWGSDQQWVTKTWNMLQDYSREKGKKYGWKFSVNTKMEKQLKAHTNHKSSH